MSDAKTTFKNTVGILCMAFAAYWLYATDGCEHSPDLTFLSAAPPLVISRDMVAATYHFTNTSEKFLHGIQINAIKDGREYSSVIVDTIKPHETATVDMGRIHSASGEGRSATVTCVDYSKPIPLYQ